MAEKQIVVGTADLTDLAMDLKEASGKPLRTVMGNLVNDAADQVLQLAQAYAPVRSGALRGSLNKHFTANTMTATVGTNIPYAQFMEYGTASRGEFGGSAYTIVPKKGKYLKFQVNGRTVYAKKVRHPGVAPRPFLRPALERVVVPLAKSMGDAAVLAITRGKNAPASLSFPTGGNVQTIGSQRTFGRVNLEKLTHQGKSIAKIGANLGDISLASQNPEYLLAQKKVGLR